MRDNEEILMDAMGSIKGQARFHCILYPVTYELKPVAFAVAAPFNLLVIYLSIIVYIYLKE